MAGLITVDLVLRALFALKNAAEEVEANKKQSAQLGSRIGMLSPLIEKFTASKASSFEGQIILGGLLDLSNSISLFIQKFKNRGYWKKFYKRSSGMM